MWNFLGNRFTGLRENSRSSSTADALNAVESVVDGTDSKIRLVPGYRKKLQGIVQDSLDFSDDLVNQIPLAIEVSNSTFTSDPYVNAFFTNVTDLQSIFSHSSEVQDYMENCHDNNARCCALLCMHREEKTIMGMELSGGTLKKDVMQTAVSFSDHRIYSPAASETETRAGLKHCLFHGLVTNALERIVQLRLTSQQLQTRRQMLHARLNRHKQQAAIEETRLELKKIEEDMLHAPLLTPQVMLQQVMNVFEKPDKFVQVRGLQLKLNKMGIKIGNGSSQPANELNLTEVTIGDNPPRVVALATFPKKELLARTEFSGF